MLLPSLPIRILARRSPCHSNPWTDTPIVIIRFRIIRVVLGWNGLENPSKIGAGIEFMLNLLQGTRWSRPACRPKSYLPKLPVRRPCQAKIKSEHFS